MYRRTAVAALAAAFSLAVPASAAGWTLGVGDGSLNVAPSAGLGAKTYRVVVDPALPLSTYDARIYAYRRAGMEPQLVVGGTGTTNHASSRGVVAAAVAAARRWPFAYSVSVVNEPNESGMGVCEYGRTFVAAHRALRRVGVRRILFGEWSPNNTLGWQSATLDPHRCFRTAKRLARIVRRVAWHGYGVTYDLGPALRLVTQQYTHQAVRLHITEAGYPLHWYGTERSDTRGAAYWTRVLRAVRRDRISQVVAWGVTQPSPHSVWNSALVEPGGRLRPSYGVIRAASHR